MSRKYLVVKYRDMVVGLLCSDRKGLYYMPLDEQGINKLSYPRGIYPVSVLVNGEYESYEPSSGRIASWIQDRIFPRERQGYNKLLQELKINRYNIWDILLRSNGVSLNDFYWVTENINQRYDEVCFPSQKINNKIPFAVAVEELSLEETLSLLSEIKTRKSKSFIRSN